MIVREHEFFKTTLPQMLEGRSRIFALLASARLADAYQEGVQYQKGRMAIGVMHSTDSGLSLARCALGHTGERIYILYACRYECVAIAGEVQKLRAHDPGSMIIVATCDCENSNKRRAFADSIRKQEVDCVVFTPDCGGVTYMRQLIDELSSLS